MAGAGAVDCSVVIPTYNAAHLIGAQLEALANQDYAGCFEVIVADNRSTDDLTEVLDQWRDRLLNLIHIRADRAQGVSVARNMGIEAARSDTILICDADDVVSSAWIRSLMAALEHHAYVGGPTETVELSGPSADWVPIPRTIDALLTSWQEVAYALGGNLGLKREVWAAAGGFDESYPAGAEEIDFAFRAKKAGYCAGFAPGALLHYRIRTDLRGVLRQQYNSGRGTATLYAKWRPDEVRPKSWPRRIHHELILLSRFPWRGSRSDRFAWLAVMAFELGKLVEARRLGCPSP